MPSSIEASIIAQVGRLSSELEKRSKEHQRLLPYAKRIEGRFPIPEAVTQAKLTKAYGRLMAMCEMPWGKLVVASKLDRLEPNGIMCPDRRVSDAVWGGVWQANAMDLEAKLGHRAALLDGRAHATVWPEGAWLLDGDPDGAQVVAGSDGGPRVQLDDAATMVVEYAEGSRRNRVGALRCWTDNDDRQYATLYRRDGIFKFQESAEKNDRDGRFRVGGIYWERREIVGEEWPLANPLKVVPVVELGVNRELAPGAFTVCSGEFSNETGLIDRINLLTFLGLVLAVSMSFPLRVVMGDKILRDDDDNPLAPFDAYIGGVVQFEDAETKIAQYDAADRGALSIYDELAQFAAATSTPRHYFPTSGAISNVSAETIRAFEGPLHAAVNGSHKPSLGEGHEEILRLGGLMLPTPVVLPQQASLSWADHESRSLAERADAFSKLAAAGANGTGLPWQASAEIALGLGQDAIRRYEAEQSGSALSTLIAAAREPAVPAQPTPPVAGGNA